MTLQVGAGNVATTLTKAKALAASAPHAVATEARTKAGPPWWVYLGGGLLLALGGFVLRGRLKIPFLFSYAT